MNGKKIRVRRHLDAWEDFSPEPGRQHVTFEDEDRLLPELSILGWLRFTRAFDHALESDQHAKEFELHYIVNGEVNWWVKKDSYVLRAGTALVIKPGERHGSETGALEPCEHYWLRIAFPRSKALPGLDKQQTKILRQAFESMERRDFPASDEIAKCFAQLVEEHRDRQDHSVVKGRAALHQLLVGYLREVAHADEGNQSAGTSSTLLACIETIRANLGNPPSVDSLSKQAGLSTTAFRKRFRKEVGYSPLDYLNRQRVFEAQRLLNREGSQIKEISHRLGCASRQCFSTVFKRVTGVSPGTYLESVRD